MHVGQGDDAGRGFDETSRDVEICCFGCPVDGSWKDADEAHATLDDFF